MTGDKTAYCQCLAALESWLLAGGGRGGAQNRLGDGILEIMKIGCWSRPRHRTGGCPQFIAYNTTWTSPNYLQKREI